MFNFSHSYFNFVFFCSIFLKPIFDSVFTSQFTYEAQKFVTLELEWSPLFSQAVEVTNCLDASEGRGEENRVLGVKSGGERGGKGWMKHNYYYNFFFSFS